MKEKILVMGVSGCGKSTVGKLLADQLGIPFLEGDDFHPQSNIDKMKMGEPLEDDDRWPWLDSIAEEVNKLDACVLSCSALKESYRKRLSKDKGLTKIVFLSGSFDLIYDRITNRGGHYMPASLLQSQFDDLEEPNGDVLAIDIELSLTDIMNKIKTNLANYSIKLPSTNQYKEMQKSDIGLLGLGVMGKSLARNFASRGLKVSVYNIPSPGEETVVTDFVTEFDQSGFYGANSLDDFVSSLDDPKVIFLMIKAGSAIDETVEKLKPFLTKDDMIIDGGNSFFKDTRRRAIDLEKEGLHFVGVGVSGGEEGALRGPAIMPAGTELAKSRILPMLQKIAAVADGQPCVSWLGTDGAGHFVKMIHNGIEYADMQLLTEAYGICKDVVGMDNIAIADLFEKWKAGKHDSYLLDITIDILREKEENGDSLLESILDVAGHKGTGKWTSIEALELGVATPAMTAAMHQRVISSYTNIRRQAEKQHVEGKTTILNHLENGMLAARLINLTEGFHMMRVASKEFDWDLKFSEISQLWRGGCIIRSEMLPMIKSAFEKDNQIEHLLLDNEFDRTVTVLANDLLLLLSEVSTTMVATPCLSAISNYYKSIKTNYLPINLIQAQRDYFGAHTYKRLDSPTVSRHTIWGSK